MSTILLNVILLNTKYILIFIKIKITQYNSLNVKLSNSQLNKFKSAIKNETEAVLRLSSNMVGDNETNFSRKLLLTNRQVSTPVNLLLSPEVFYPEHKVQRFFFQKTK